MADDITNKKGEASAMWGGRFSAGPSAVMEAINASIGFDKKLYAQDIAGSKAHATMLGAQGIIAAADVDQILAGLDQVMAEIEAGSFEFKASLEDIHMNVEARLREIIGDAAGRLHTARSRNDQVATDLKLWVRDALDSLDRDIQALQRALIDQAEKHSGSVMPGFTHLQTAQPVTMGHHLMAYVEMLGRDRARAQDARERMNQSPLGAAALAGTSFPIDPMRRPNHWVLTVRLQTLWMLFLTVTLRWNTCQWRRSCRSIFRVWPRKSCFGVQTSLVMCGYPMNSRPVVQSCRKNVILMRQSLFGPRQGALSVCKMP